MFNYFKKFIIGLKNSRFVNQDVTPSKPDVEGQEEAPVETPEAGTTEGAAAEASEQAEDTAKAAKEIIDMKLTPKEVAAEQAKEDARRVASGKLTKDVDDRMATARADVAAKEISAELPDLGIGGLERDTTETKTRLAEAAKAVKGDTMVFTSAQTEMSPEEAAKDKEATSEKLKADVDKRMEVTRAADEAGKDILEKGV